MLAGPKGATRPEAGGAGEGGLPELPGMGGLPGLPGMDGGGAAPGTEACWGSGHAAAAGPILGIIDDVMIPAMRYLGPMISSLSPAAKSAERASRPGHTAPTSTLNPPRLSAASRRRHPNPPDNKPDSKPSLSNKTADNRPTRAWKALKIKSNKINAHYKNGTKPFRGVQIAHQHKKITKISVLYQRVISVILTDPSPPEGRDLYAQYTSNFNNLDPFCPVLCRPL